MLEQRLIDDAEAAIAASADLSALESVRVAWLGKNGHLTTLLKQLSSLSESDRRLQGALLNEAKNILTTLIQEKKQILEKQKLFSNQNIGFDPSLPGRGQVAGRLHPVSRSLNRIQQWFLAQGFACEEGPEIENEFYNFEALNIPPHHPARAMHDTFYLPDAHLLRTHTSPVQIRAMQAAKPPFRMIVPGKVYRCDFDVSHTPMFHQVEGLVVDHNIHFGHLKSILTDFLSAFFEKKLNTRFRASYFPFTEPSAEVDIQCILCEGHGCRLCSHTGWIEILGCGMVHPAVLENVQLDPKNYSGFAFGMGVERITMLKYGINDLRLFFENDLRFLEQF